MDLFQDLRDEVLKWLPHDKSDRAALMALDEWELAARFFNWLERLVHAHPRVAAKSREYLSLSLSADEVENLKRLVEKIENGKELEPHLSRSVSQGFTPGAPTGENKLSDRRDLDLLLNDWGIHHLHLSHDLESDGFVRRGGLVLYAIFKADTAYLLEVMAHEWTDQHLVEVAVRNWPGAELFRSFQGVNGLETAVSRSDRKGTRSAGIASPIEVDGKVYMSRMLGLTASGISIAATTRAQGLLDTIEDITQQLGRDPQYFRSRVKQLGKSYPANPQFHLLLCKGASGFGFAIKEQATGVIIPIAA